MGRGYLTACPPCIGFCLHAYQIQGKVWHCVIFHQILWIIDHHWLKKETLHRSWILSKDKYLNVLSAKVGPNLQTLQEWQSLNVSDESCWEENIKVTVTNRVAEVVRGHGGPSPRSLDSDENFKPEHTLHTRTFVRSLGKKNAFWGQKQCFLG